MEALQIEVSKEVKKNYSKLYNFTDQEFIDNAQRFLEALKEKRVFCVIHSVSQSGMTRNMSFHEHCFDINNKEGRIYNFNALFVTLGYKEAKNGGFKISGCDMNMVFATVYDVVNDLHRMGFIDKVVCEDLAQSGSRITTF